MLLSILQIGLSRGASGWLAPLSLELLVFTLFHAVVLLKNPVSLEYFHLSEFSVGSCRYIDMLCL